MARSIRQFTEELIAESGWSTSEAPKFAAWWFEVDKIVTQAIGVSTFEIGDWDYATAFEYGRKPTGVARQIISLYKRGEL